MGIFTSAAERHRLAEEEAAIGELLKGKATSMPKRHAGEGIFFASKACDRFALRSHRGELVIDTRKKDTFVNVRVYLKGTEVSLPVSCSARRKLADVFSAFAPEDFDFRFEPSLVDVRFYAGEYVFRSEARRLLARRDKFREAILDFSRVKSIRQGFADKIFRVFATAHLGVALKRVKVAPGIEVVIRHVVDNRVTISGVAQKSRREGGCLRLRDRPAGPSEDCKDSQLRVTRSGAAAAAQGCEFPARRSRKQGSAREADSCAGMGEGVQ